jgi:hypothetical protein
MRVVVSYLETNGLTTGSTHILWADPAHDLGFFYRNMKASLEELEGLPKEATPLEKTNVLMKLREALLDSNKDGSTIVLDLAAIVICLCLHIGVRESRLMSRL